MKITIDEIVINKAIQQGKLEVAQWLLDNGCPINETAYIQNLNETVLKWVYSKNVMMPKTMLSSVIDNAEDSNVIMWFIDCGCVVDKSTFVSCIRNRRNELFWDLVKKYKVVLDVEAYRAAVMSENIEILDYLLKINCIWDETVTETAMKFKKKESLKWLVMNDKF